jgi:hypothetical protein
VRGVIARREVDAEAVPSPLVPVLEMLLEAPHEVGGRSHVVQGVLPVQHVDAAAPLDGGPDEVGVFLKDIAVDVLQEGLKDEVGLGGHGEGIGDDV